MPRSTRASKVPIYSAMGGRWKVKGEVTGNTYLFQQGVPLDVDERDVPGLLAMTKKGACCGNKKAFETNLFVRA